jgi:hypothetical protein
MFMRGLFDLILERGHQIKSRQMLDIYNMSIFAVYVNNFSRQNSEMFNLKLIYIKQSN